MSDDSVQQARAREDVTNDVQGNLGRKAERDWEEGQRAGAGIKVLVAGLSGMSSKLMRPTGCSKLRGRSTIHA